MSNKERDIKGASVDLYTWGTENKAHNLSRFLKSQLKGGNVGHTALAVTFPATKEGVKLIEQYCLDGERRVLPYHREKKNIQIGESSEGQPKFSQQDFFTVYFSWWPPADNNANAELSLNINEDNQMERSGSSWVNGTPVANYLDLETRTYKGYLGKTKMTLSPEMILHDRALSHKEKQYAESQKLLSELDRHERAIIFLEKKLNNIKTNIRISDSMQAVFSRYLGDSEIPLHENRVLDAQSAKKIVEEIIKPKKEDLADQIEQQTGMQESLIRELRLINAEKIAEEISILKEQLELLPESFRAQHLNNISQSNPVVYQKYKIDNLKQEQNVAQIVGVTMNVAFNFNDLKESEKTLDFLFEDILPDEFSGSISKEQEKKMNQWRVFLPEDQKDISRKDMTPELFQAICKKGSEQSRQLTTLIKEEEYKYRFLFSSEHPLLVNGRNAIITEGYPPTTMYLYPFLVYHMETE